MSLINNALYHGDHKNASLHNGCIIHEFINIHCQTVTVEDKENSNCMLKIMNRRKIIARGEAECNHFFEGW